MILLTARYRVKKGQVDAALEPLRRMAQLVRKQEPGCSRYQVFRARDDAQLLLLLEEYQDDAALEAHRQTAHFREIIQEQVIPLLDSREPTVFDLVIA